MTIPKIIHQTYSSPILPNELENIVKDLKSKNPDWEYRFYDENARSSYILKNYGLDVFEIYSAINPSYGAARADLFRYLVVYKEGGVYLDIKSICTIPLSELIKPEDEFLISSWPNESGEFKGAGLKIELSHIKGGEYQQWYIVAKPNSEFLKAVIDRVVENIKYYNPWKYGVAKRGVLKLTGPIPYTLAIHPLRNSYSHRYVRTHDEFSLKYTMLKNSEDHVKIMKNHYSLISQPIIIPKNTYQSFLYKSFIIVRFFTYGLMYKIIFRKKNNRLSIKEECAELIDNLKKF